MKNHQGTPEKTSSRFLEISFKDVHEDSLGEKKIVFMDYFKSFKGKKNNLQKKKRLARKWYREGV